MIPRGRTITNGAPIEAGALCRRSFCCTGREQRIRSVDDPLRFRFRTPRLSPLPENNTVMGDSIAPSYLVSIVRTQGGEWPY